MSSLTMATLTIRQGQMASGNSSLVCITNPSGRPSGGIFRGQNPLFFPSSLLLLQLSVISLAPWLIHVFIRPLRQSTIISQIGGGILFGPSLLGHAKVFGSRLFPDRSMVILDTISQFGIMFFLFEIGVKSDSRMMIYASRKSKILGCAAIFVTIGVMVPIAVVIKKYVPMESTLSDALIIISTAQCLTPFPNMAIMLTEMELVNTDLGRLAISSSMFCDMIGVSLTAVGFTVLHSTINSDPLTPILSSLTILALVGSIILVARPLLLYFLKRRQGKPLKEPLINGIFIGVMLSGLTSEIIGQHFVLGPLIFGLAVPDGPPLGSALVSKLEYPISKILYPAFLTCSGVKTDVFKVHSRSLEIIGFLVLLSCVIKIAAVMGAAYFMHIPMDQAFVVGLMMNTRGICELTLYNLYRDAEVLTEQDFSICVISMIAVNMIISPLLRSSYDPTKQHIQSRRRTIQHTKNDSELRIQICIKDQDNVPSFVNLLEASCATETSPIAVIAVILVELVGRSAPMLISHQHQRTLEPSTSSSDPIINALRQYEIYNEQCATVQAFSSVSVYETMHDDICKVALDQNVVIVIVPFHKKWAIDGTIGSVNRHMQSLNHKVLKFAPCSVGIFIDRGILTGSLSILNAQTAYHVAVLYIGGPDDVECLFYGARMARHKTVTLTVIRFLLFGGDNTRERMLDSELIDNVRLSNSGNTRFIYREEVVRNGVGLASSIKGLDQGGFDLMLVGRQHPESALMAGLDAWSECEDLGVVGDMLASPDFKCTTSVLVVQQQRVRGKLISRTTKVYDKDVPRGGGSGGGGSNGGQINSSNLV